MFKRPKPGEDEDDILCMQEEFLRERAKNQNLQLAAQVVNLRRTEPTKRPNNNEPATKKPSKYAQSKGLKSQGEKRVKFEENEFVMGEVMEKNIENVKHNLGSTSEAMAENSEPVDKEDSIPGTEDDKVYFPKVIPSILGNIVEKNLDSFVEFDVKPMPAEGFPTVSKQDFILMGRNTIDNLKTGTQMDIDMPTRSNTPKTNNINLPDKSYIVSTKEATEIHNENVKLLNKMSESEILEEQQKLLSSLDSKLIDFIRSKRMNTDLKQNKSIGDNLKMDLQDNLVTSGNNKDKNVTDEEMSAAPFKIKLSNEQLTEVIPTPDDTLWENDVLSHPEVNKWLHFDCLEKDKLQWMKGIEQHKQIKPDEPYEARFDFKGYLLPYTIELTEETKSLFHHGDEPHRPGYTLTELFELSRSTITQQRVMSLNTIAGILDYYNAGVYINIIEIPLSKILFILRIAMDENKVILLEPALKAMRNLIYNRFDEESLDALIGFDEGTSQPCLENDKSEIKELDSRETELKDFHLAEIDIIAALLRTDILQRLYYILETVKPSFNSVHYCLQILTRLARDSVDTAMKIVQKEHLMTTIINNFVPNTGVNFVFEPLIVYSGKPIFAAMKLFRVLSLQSKEISNTLVIKYDILKPLSIYISSAADRSYGLHIQMEAFCILSNLLNYGLGVDVSTSIYPLAITALYKHVHGTDIYITSSVISATHCAVVLQFIKKFVCCSVQRIDSIKSQLYPLLIDGTQKWLIQLSQSDSFTCGHLRLLCSALDCYKTIISSEVVPVELLKALKDLCVSTGFQKLIENLLPSSNLLSGIENKDLHLVKNLMSLGSVVIDSPKKVLPVLNVASPVPFLTSLFDLLNYLNEKEIQGGFLKHLSIYLRKLAKNTPSLCDNWFTRIETDLVFYIMKLAVNNDVGEEDKDILYAVANKLCYILRIDKKFELDILFNSVVFNKYWFTAERLLNLVNLSDADGFSKALTSIEDIKNCYSRVVNLSYEDTGHNVVLRRWKEPILPRDWLYLPILMLYSKSQETEALPNVGSQHTRKQITHIYKEKEFIVICSLEWILFNELCFPDILKDIDVTDRFCRIMCIFLCDNSLFLDSKIKILLKKCTQTLFKQKAYFDFDKHLVGLNNFQDLFTQFLEQFQSVSYGDYTFAACVLVPLAQRHNVKWRKLLWSEYAGCLRALDCPVEYLCYELQDYLYPSETDESLIKSYFQAFSSNLLRPDTIAYKIAKHHIECFKNRSNVGT
ncbi:hypothetical protein K1T71_011518 [Dendrolimus kikuchii]|uniref:Uncharacterized protein n=1 Tax=Dendrolimus kikuchii TaxID=765133 RepID=A0ACC1CP56_9NEOP|nr:hypothetical protein K1T71_011518 [Dendrolimus kikuchii]